jgi:2-keto-4-pentenoate hydratase/2-oxohepta-3-ene-1,7-dioic acid hydratase in catechol pathway
MAIKGERAPGEAEIHPDARRARGMASGLTLLTMQHNGGFRLGVKTGKGVLDVTEASRLLHMHAPATLDDLLQDEDGPSLNALVEAACESSGSEKVFVDEQSMVYGPVVTRPEKIVCVGLNYRRHAKEVGLPIPKQPVLFSKFNNALSGHNRDVKLPVEVAHKFDYETELVIVIGKNAKDVSEADALSHVAGYCVGNDLSARDLQFDNGG